jgi:hypothetical protein
MRLPFFLILERQFQRCLSVNRWVGAAFPGPIVNPNVIPANPGSQSGVARAGIHGLSGVNLDSRVRGE